MRARTSAEKPYCAKPTTTKATISTTTSRARKSLDLDTSFVIA